MRTRRRHSSRGLGRMLIARRVRGLGALPGGAVGEAIIPAAAGAGVAALAAMYIRKNMDPAEGPMQWRLVRHAPLAGAAAGALVGVGLGYMAGMPAGLAAAASALFAGLTGMVVDKSHVDEQVGGRVTATVAAQEMPDFQNRPPSGGGGGSGQQQQQSSGLYGFVTPRSLNGVYTFEQFDGRRRPGSLGALPSVGVRGVNLNAFGVPSFQA